MTRSATPGRAREVFACIAVIAAIDLTCALVLGHTLVASALGDVARAFWRVIAR